MADAARNAPYAWRPQVFWADDRVEKERLVMLPDPGDHAGDPVVVRTANGVAVARLERSDVGFEGRVHPSLARTLQANGERFTAEWRPARRFDLVSHADRVRLGIVVLTCLTGALTAALALPDTAKKIGWTLAAVVLALTLSLVVLKAHKEWSELQP